MLCKISFTQNHLSITDFAEFICTVIGNDEKTIERLCTDQWFTMGARHVGDFLQRILAAWTDRYNTREDIPDSDDGNGPHLILSGPVLRVNVEPVCNMQEQFGVPDTRGCKAMHISMCDPWRELEKLLGDGSRVARGDDILSLVAEMMDSGPRNRSN